MHRVKAGTCGQIHWQPGARGVAHAAGHAIGHDLKRVLAGARLEAQRANHERAVALGLVQLVTRRHLDISQGLAAAVEDTVRCGTREDFAADGGIGPDHIRQLGLDLQAVAQAPAPGECGGEHVAFDLTHVDQTDEQRRDDGVAHQGHAVAGRIAVLHRWFQHKTPTGGEDARLVEQLRHHRGCLFGSGGYTDPHGLGRAVRGRVGQARLPTAGWRGGDGGGLIARVFQACDGVLLLCVAGILLCDLLAQTLNLPPLLGHLLLQCIQAFECSRFGGCLLCLYRCAEQQAERTGTPQDRPVSGIFCHHIAPRV